MSKFVAYHWAPQARAGDLLGRVERTLGRAQSKGYGAIEAAHCAEVEQFWRRSDVELDGDAELPSHVLAEVAQTADEAVVINHGRLIVHAPLNELMNGRSGQHVRVRSSQQAELARVCRPLG